MLRCLSGIFGYRISATDGEIGTVRDFFFDDQQWTVRYLVVETGGWFHRRQVLIAPASIGQPDWGSQVLPVSLTMDQVRTSPDIDTNMPVSGNRRWQ